MYSYGINQAPITGLPNTNLTVPNQQLNQSANKAPFSNADFTNQVQQGAQQLGEYIKQYQQNHQGMQTAQTMDNMFDNIGQSLSDFKDWAADKASSGWEATKEFFGLNEPEMPAAFSTTSNPVVDFSDYKPMDYGAALAGNTNTSIGIAQGGLPTNGATSFSLVPNSTETGLLSTLDEWAGAGQDWFADHKDLVGAGKTAWDIFNGINNFLISRDQLAMAKDQYNTQKDMLYKNYNNQVKAYNSQLEDRYRNRAYVETGNEHAYDDELEKKKL